MMIPLIMWLIFNPMKRKIIDSKNN
jgi:hypothetical protein